MTPEQFLQIADPLPEPLVLVSAEGTILAANRNGGRRLDLSREQWGRRNLREFVAGPPEAVSDYLRTCSRTRQPIPGAVMLRGPDGLPVACRCEGYVVRPRTDDAGPLVLLRLIPKGRAVEQFLELNRRIEQLSHEIARRMQAETALLKANAELLQRNGEIQDFVYAVSHDLKSPLVTIQGFIGFLQEDLKAGRTDEVVEGLQRIERAARRMNDLIHDILQIGRVGQVEHAVEDVDVTQLVREISDGLTDRIAACGATLDVQDDLPVLRASRARLRDVFENLLNNAIKYGCNGRQPKITIGCEQADREVRFFVRDNGPGISAEYHARIFGLFQRLDTTHEGTGVGLAIVARIMQVHGGRAWVESVSGQGATFWLAFPETLRSPSRRNIAAP